MRLRTQLMFVSLMTLALPWAGCQYAREFESALRQSQQNALTDSAGAIANILSERPSLLVRDPVQLTAATGNPDDDIYAAQLPSFVTLDGFYSDWSRGNRLTPLRGGARAEFAAGIDKSGIWLFVSVHDNEVIYERPGLDDSDRILIDYEEPGGRQQQLRIATSGVGRTAVMRKQDDQWVQEPAAQAVWEATTSGYDVEIRLRNRLVGARLGVVVVDADNGSLSRSASYTGSLPGFLLHRSAALEQALAEFPISNRRIFVVDDQGWIIGSVGEIPPGVADDEYASYPLLEKLVRRIVKPSRAPPPLPEIQGSRLGTDMVESALDGTPAARWFSADNERTAIVVSAHPVTTTTGVAGAVIIEQSSEAILTLTDRALTRLVTLTLIATLLAAAALVGFATYLSLRIRRLSRAAEQAVGPDGEINSTLPETRSGDEIGDLSRSFAGLLTQLREHTEYLRSLASKLSHELRTPLAVVQSSLDNLEAAGLPDEAKIYAHRAREGSARLRSILTAMSEASRVEQAIEHADTEQFDLRELVQGCVNGYRDVHADRRFTVAIPEQTCPIEGVPELVAQMLDKLVDNAVDFTPDDGLIEVTLVRDATNCTLRVANEGPPLPAQMQGQLFDSMVSLRSGKNQAPHLGFGLHIARLIAESHRGRIGCRNLPGDRGAEFFVKFRL